jgi:hypothetical protein
LKEAPLNDKINDDKNGEIMEDYVTLNPKGGSKHSRRRSDN